MMRIHMCDEVCFALIEIIHFRPLFTSLFEVSRRFEDGFGVPKPCCFFDCFYFVDEECLALVLPDPKFFYCVGLDVEVRFHDRFVLIDHLQCDFPVLRIHMFDECVE